MNAIKGPGHRAFGVAAALVALAAAACTQPRPAEMPASGVVAAPQAVIVPAPAPSEDGTPAQSPPAAVAALPPMAAPAEVALAITARPLPDPGRLVGLPAAELSSLLGAPDFVRRDAPAEIWQYQAGTCVLDVFLYREGKGESAPTRVAHFEVRGRTVENVSARDCYARLLADRRR